MSIALKKNLKLLKENFALTSTEIAHRININIDTLKSYEFGSATPPYNITIALANIFNVSIDFLIFNDNLFINYIFLFHLAEESNKLPNMDRSYIDDSVNQFIRSKSIDKRENVRLDSKEIDYLSASIHDNIKILREKNKLTQSDLAKLLNLSSKVSISQYENKSNPPFPVLKKISEKFKISAHYLLTGKPLVFDIEDTIFKKNLLLFDAVATIQEIKVITALLKKVIENNTEK